MKVTYYTNKPLTFKYTYDELEIAINGIIEQKDIYSPVKEQ